MRTRPILVLVAALLASFAMPAGAQTITRGPYLQMLSHNAITVRWQTDVASDSRVIYGSSPSTLTSTASNGASVVEHEIRLTGLASDATYYYSVGTSTTILAGGDSTYRFKTAPVPGTAKPTRIWVLGDSGTGGDGTGRAESVRDGYYNSALYQDPDFWMMLGDNAYDNGTEFETTRAIFQTYPTMLRKAALWSTCGNHETYTGGGAPYYNAFTFPTGGECGGKPSGSEQYYSFDYANIHFVCLNSEGNRAVGSPQLVWLEQDLANTSQKWIVAFWHCPPYSKGSHNSDSENALIQMRTNALPILENYGVDLVMCGHSHSYERSMLIDGHYGLSTTFDPAIHAKNSGDGRETGNGAYQKEDGSHKGTVYVVAGNSGKTSGGNLNHPVMIISRNTLGSMIIDVSGNRMDVREIGTNGVAFDNFTLIKGPLGPQLSVSGWHSVCDHAGTPRALASVDNSFVEPRQAGIRRLEITFSEPITVSNLATAVTISGVNAAGAVNLGSLGITTNNSASGDKLVVEFSNSGGACALPDAVKWSFQVNPAVVAGASGALLPTGSSNPPRVIAGLAGDVSGNGRANGIDVNRIANSGVFNPTDPQSLRADVNGDGTIDSADAEAAWSNRQKRTDNLAQP